jgi:hypothetical protein
VNADDLPSAAKTFPVLRWIPWVEPPTAPYKAAGADEETLAKWSPFYLTLQHDPRVLEKRTALYNGIMTGTGSLAKDDRELATSLAPAASTARRCTAFARCSIERPGDRGGAGDRGAGSRHRSLPASRHGALRHRAPAEVGLSADDVSSPSPRRSPGRTG